MTTKCTLSKFVPMCTNTPDDHGNHSLGNCIAQRTMSCEILVLLLTCFIPYRALTQANSNLQYEYRFVSKNFIPDSCHLWNDCSMYESLYK